MNWPFPLCKSTSPHGIQCGAVPQPLQWQVYSTVRKQLNGPANMAIFRPADPSPRLSVFGGAASLGAGEHACVRMTNLEKLNVGPVDMLGPDGHKSDDHHSLGSAWCDRLHLPTSCLRRKWR